MCKLSSRSITTQIPDLFYLFWPNITLVYGPVLSRSQTRFQEDRMSGFDFIREHSLMTRRYFCQLGSAQQSQPGTFHRSPRPGRMTMHGSGVKALHKVKGDGRIDHKSKQTGANHIPKRHRHKKAD
jgi:hypothetical protein